MDNTVLCRHDSGQTSEVRSQGCPSNQTIQAAKGQVSWTLKTLTFPLTSGSHTVSTPQQTNIKEIPHSNSRGSCSFDGDRRVSRVTTWSGEKKLWFQGPTVSTTTQERKGQTCSLAPLSILGRRAIVNQAGINCCCEGKPGTGQQLSLAVASFLCLNRGTDIDSRSWSYRGLRAA